MIYDCFTFRDELDILEIRLSILDKVVDKFVICEANKTFTNQLKPYNYLNHKDRFKQWKDKIIYLPIELDDTGLDFTTKDKQYTPTSAAWQFEYSQRNALAYGVQNCKPDDIIMMGDADEIPNPSNVKDYGYPVVYIMDLYCYYVNNKNIGPRDELWGGTAQLTKQQFDSLQSFQNLRDIKNNFTPIKSGWHLSYMGGKDIIKTKISSFSHTEFNKDEYTNDKHIEECLEKGKDLFNREGINFTIVDLNKEYSESIRKIFDRYPHLIYESKTTNK